MASRRGPSRPVILISLFLLSLGTWLHAETPAIFEDLSYEKALAASASDGKLFILDAMTSWCGPCKKMDATTWVEPGLVAWLTRNAIALQLDMDEHEKLKTELSIRAFPTIVVFKNGKEFDRVVGYRSAAQMHEWLLDVAKDRTELDRVKEELEQVRKLGGPVRARLPIAAALLEYGEYAEATEEYVWLWEQTDASRRGSAIKWSMKSLAKKYAPARERFMELRDGLATKVAESAASSTEVRDWLILSSVVDDEAGVVPWVANLIETVPGRALAREHGRQLFGLLREQGRWRLAGLVLAQPIEAVKEMGENLGAYDLPAAHAVAPASTAKATPGKKSMPAIPMGAGGMQPARKITSDEATRESRTAEESAKKTTKPAIPMGGGGMQPARPLGTPKAKKKSMPAIPMGSGGMTPARKPDSAKKSVPMTPMTGGGMQPARSTTRAAKAREVASEVRFRLTNEFRKSASEYYGALLAADRHLEADAVARMLLRYDDGPTSRMSLVASAIEAGQASARQEQHVRWLYEAAAAKE